ncbi:MAG: hypothetical protein ACXVW9_13390 [Nocardioidaceae bacterium]
MNPPEHAFVRTAGTVVRVEAEDARLGNAVLAATGSTWTEQPADEAGAEVTLHLEASRRSFALPDPVPVTRGVWAARDGRVLVDSAGGSGFSQLWSVDGTGLHVRSRWTPTLTESVAAAGLRSRTEALRAQVLLHYPVLWWAASKGLAPLHVSLVEIDGVAVLLAGPGGVGKSTLVARELARGANAACDNLAVSDGVTAFGLGEPLRLPRDAGVQAAGGRTTHGRRQQPWHHRVPELRPELLVVVHRGDRPDPVVRAVHADTATRTLVAGTFAAGELRRFWQLAAGLSLGTGLGPALAPVEEVAATLTRRLPCFEIELGRKPGAGLHTLLRSQLIAAHRNSRRGAHR